LLADDEPALLDLYAAWLGDEDVAVVRATCGATALDRCETVDVDVAMLDRHMPRVSGDEVVDALADRADAPRIAFLTAASPELDILDVGIDAYLTKPVDSGEFVAAVRSLLRRDRLPEIAERYVAGLSKRAALLSTASRGALRTDPDYVSFEDRLSRLAGRVDHRLDDPYLRRIDADEPPDESPA
jgi:DNA-binding response OmpR family regulator